VLLLQLITLDLANSLVGAERDECNRIQQ